VKEIISKKMLAFQLDAEFGVEESCGRETASRKGRDDKCLVRSRSRVTGVALEWHQLRNLILEATRPMRESASPKLHASRRLVALKTPKIRKRLRLVDFRYRRITVWSVDLGPERKAPENSEGQDSRRSCTSD
jgi:hypothetical protein